MSLKTPRATKQGRWLRRVPLAVQLTAWYTTAAFVVVAVATGIFYYFLANNLRMISEQSLRDEVDVCRELIRERGGDSHALHEEVEIDSAVRRYQKFNVRVLDPAGKALSTTPGMDNTLPKERVAQAAETNKGIFWIDSPSGATYRAVVARVPVGSTARDMWTLQVAVDLTQEEIVLGQQRFWMWIVLGSALIVCPWIGFTIARRGIRPVREVADTARHIGSSTLNERIHGEEYPVEIRALADSFNAMLERLEEAFARLSRFSADIAHELRTPVNNIRGEAEVVLGRERAPGEYKEALGSCLEEAVRLSELIESLLFLARSESPGDHLKRTREEMRSLLTDLRDYYEAAAHEAGVTLQVTGGEGVSAEVDRNLLQRALGNLVSNSLAHCARGDSISLRAERVDGTVRVAIHDTGSGIAAENLPFVFDRFYRADPSRARNSGGAGLGLAIVRQIIQLHGGEVTVASEPEAGTTFTVSLPAGSNGAARVERA